jgi:hypothetical protein
MSGLVNDQPTSSRKHLAENDMNGLVNVQPTSSRKHLAENDMSGLFNDQPTSSRKRVAADDMNGVVKKSLISKPKAAFVPTDEHIESSVVIVLKDGRKIVVQTYNKPAGHYTRSRNGHTRGDAYFHVKKMVNFL